MKTILFLFGGVSSEYAVSLESAQAVLTHLDQSKFRPLMVGITRDGRWLHYTGSLDAIGTDCWHETDCVPCTLVLHRGARQLLLLDGAGTTRSFDAAFPVMHGKNGEDGTLQGLLELSGVPIVGCGTLASAIAMDKDRAHKLAACAGVEIPRGAVFPRGAAPEAWESAAAELGYPLFVKPVRAGSSFGITQVTAPSQLAAALEEAWRHDREALLEEAVPGFEVGCAVLGIKTLTVGAVDQVALSQGFFDYTEKYTLKTASIHCPAPILPEEAARIQEAAKVVYRALDLKGFARVDFFLTPGGRVVFNEVNTIPGFTAHSRYPRMMAAAGLPFSALITRLIEEEVGGV